MKILANVEKYLIVFTTLLYILLIFIFGPDNIILNLIEKIIKYKNDVIVNVASLFIGMYITLVLMYPTFTKGSSLDKLSNKNYLTSFRYIVIGLLCSFIYILNFLLEGILYKSNILNCFFLILLFISFIRVVLLVIVSLKHDIITQKLIKNDNIKYDKKIYEKLKNIEDRLEEKKK
ncbi:hypothetical protein [Staphylococcus sp. Marseille-Q5304]|uniref:hypothetical protein n=1 Tax=Staphylococcus sp. Marseille-Q5304 TaxID=2942200 RepID=UPI002073DC82|nr:hypothetical protein [Staphylococcus sp. Marseille-Q5304]